MDASTSYMVSPRVPIRINNFSDSRKKFIAILRHPVDRVQSAYTFRLNRHESNDTRRMDEIIPKNIDSKSLNLGKLLQWEKENVREADLSKREKESWRESGFPYRGGTYKE